MVKNLQDVELIHAIAGLDKNQKEDVMDYINHIIKVAELVSPKRQAMEEINIALKQGYKF